MLAPRWMGNWHCQRMRGALCFLKASSGRRVLFALRFAALRPGFLGRGERRTEPHAQAAPFVSRARLEEELRAVRFGNLLADEKPEAEPFLFA